MTKIGRPIKEGEYWPLKIPVPTKKTPREEPVRNPQIPEEEPLPEKEPVPA